MNDEAKDEQQVTPEMVRANFAIFWTLVIVAVFTVLSLSACSSIPGEAAQMAKDTKSGSVVCTKFQGIWGSGTIVIANLEQGVIRNGGVTVGQDCGQIAVTTSQTITPPKEPAK